MEKLKIYENLKENCRISTYESHFPRKIIYDDRTQSWVGITIHWTGNNNSNRRIEVKYDTFTF